MSINKVILIGNVGRDPEVRHLDNNVSVANFSLATTERGYTGRNGQTVPERTEWHNIVAWRGLAEISEKYIRKGTQIYVEGKLRSRSYDDKDGIKRYITEIFADSIQLLGRKSDNPASNDQTDASTQNNFTPSANSPMTQDLSQQSTNDEILGEETDDLPF